MRPFFFGCSDHPLFGIYHAPSRRASRPAAVLLCNPFGQESIRAHRIYATLADKLSKDGQHVLRFDFHGTGDSAGEVEEGSQAMWIQDTLDAHEELLATSGVSRIIWVGMGYGATLAVLAARSLRRSISGMILWDPVVDGTVYLQELSTAHADFMQRDMRYWQPSGPLGSECLGFPLGLELKEAISTVNLTQGKPPHVHKMIVLTTSPNPTLARFQKVVADWTDSTQWIELSTSTPWNSDRAMNMMLVPMDVLDVIVAKVGEIS